MIILKTYSFIFILFKGSTEAKPFYTLDIETIEYKGGQVPLLITLASRTYTEYFLANKDLSLVEAFNDLFDQLFHFLSNNLTDSVNTIFVHNLGGFDGIFIYKYLSQHFNNGNLKTIIDDANRFILISVKINDIEIVFKDSLRIFPCSLNELCKVFNVPGKLHEYKDEYNHFSVYDNPELLNELIQYALQDSKSLFLALLSAQHLYLQNYNVDITTVVSIPSLAFKIFRLKYLSQNIPVLSSFNDSYIRNSYFGGSTDIYECYAKDLYYYDVNSLYPYAMCRPMPLNLIKSYRGGSGIKLDKFFGFLEVEIECPDSVFRPVLPYRLNGRTIFPRGVFKGFYFSEELKAVLPLGYKILKIYSAKEFDSAYLFNDYVNDMYRIKMNSVGAERWISKLLQNSLYGLFGRKQEVIETLTINKNDLHKYIVTNIIKTIIPIDEYRCSILMIKNINFDMVKELNLNFNLGISEYAKTINSNVAIASAITAYARIHMIPFPPKRGGSLILPLNILIQTQSSLLRNYQAILLVKN